MLKTISAYYLKLKAKQEVMNDNKDSIDLMAQVRTGFYNFKGKAE